MSLLRLGIYMSHMLSPFNTDERVYFGNHLKKWRVREKNFLCDLGAINTVLNILAFANEFYSLQMLHDMNSVMG